MDKDKHGWYLKGYEENESLEEVAKAAEWKSQMKRDWVETWKNFREYLKALKE